MASRSPLSTSRDSIRDVAADAHYLSSNCVVYVYYSDVRAVIEEHFSKALGSQQQTNFSGDNKTKDPVIPMSQRNLPLSFWKADYTPSPSGHQPTATQTQEAASSQESSSSASSSTPFFMSPTQQTAVPGHEALYGPEAAAYHHHHHHHHSSRYPPIQNDPWHYTLSAAATAANPYSSHHHHRTPSSSSMHDLGYSSASNRFNAQYSSLLLQPRSSRLTPVPGAFEKAGADMSWLGAARYHHEAAMNFGHHHGMEAAGYTASAYGAAMSAAISGMESH